MKKKPNKRKKRKAKQTLLLKTVAMADVRSIKAKAIGVQFTNPQKRRKMYVASVGICDESSCPHDVAVALHNLADCVERLKP